MKMRITLLIGVLLISAGMLLAGTTWADALPPPPACPPGSRGTTTHAGQRCEPAPCKDDGDCKEVGGSCRSWRVCTRSSSVRNNRRAPDAPPQQEDIVVGTCEPAQNCTGEEEPPPPMVGKLGSGPPHCVTAKYCVPASLPALPKSASPSTAPGASAPRVDKGPRSNSCGCRLGTPQADPAWWGLLLLAAAFCVRRSS